MAEIPKDLGFGQAHISNFSERNLRGILQGIADDLAAFGVTQDAIIAATSFIVLNAIPSTVISTTKEV